MYKTIGMVAHVDAGKTTLLEQILYHTDTIRQAGRVDNQNTFLDYHTIEKERGITVFSDQAVTTCGNITLQLIDTPGHVDFSSEMERAVRILDYAVIILSAVEGIEGHTETVWHLLRKYNIPTLFFINKLDRVGANLSQVMKEIKERFTKDMILLTQPSLSENGVQNLLVNPTTELIESIAERDDTLMEKYLNDQPIQLSEIKNIIKTGFNQCELFPCLCGSALQGIGIRPLLDILQDLLHTQQQDMSHEPLSGRVYKIRHDEADHKLAFIKLKSGQLSVKDTIEHTLQDGEKKQIEKKLIRLESITALNIPL